MRVTSPLVLSNLPSSFSPWPGFMGSGFSLSLHCLCASAWPQMCVEQGRVSRSNPIPCGVLVVPIGVPSAMPHLLDSPPSAMTRVWLQSSSHIQWTFHVFEALAMFQALSTVCTSFWVSPISQMKQWRGRNGAGRWGPLSPPAYPLVHSTSICPWWRKAPP